MKMMLLVWWLLTGGSASAGPVRVDVVLSTRGDDISFDKQLIEVPSGRRLEITFKNEASERSAITHNTVVLLPGTETETFRRLHDVSFDLSQMAGDPGILALGTTLAPGDSETLSLRFPGPGSYPFVCLMPGHGDMMGMRGIIVVRGR